MFIFANLLTATAYIVNTILWLFSWIIVIRALISWVNPDPRNVIVFLLHKITEPVLAPIRRKIPTGISNSGIDFSPIIAFLIIMFLRKFLVKTLFDLALRISS